MSFVWHTLDTLTGLLRRHRADDSVHKAIRSLTRADLIVVDLCRYRDYADIAVAALLSGPSLLGFSAFLLAGLSA